MVANITLIIVGVADNVGELVASHESVERNVEEVKMPRMNRQELREILQGRLSQLGMTAHRDAEWKIVVLARGLPTYVHRLGKLAVFSALDGLNTVVNDNDVDRAITDLLGGSQQSLRDKYEIAIRSNQPGNRFKEALLACALAHADDAGYFTPASICEPMSGILSKPVESLISRTT